MLVLRPGVQPSCHFAGQTDKAWRISGREDRWPYVNHGGGTGGAQSL